MSGRQLCAVHKFQLVANLSQSLSLQSRVRLINSIILHTRPRQDYTQLVMLQESVSCPRSKYPTLTSIGNSHPLPTRHSCESVRHYWQTLIGSFSSQFRTSVSIVQCFPLTKVHFNNTSFPPPSTVLHQPHSQAPQLSDVNMQGEPGVFSRISMM